MPSFDRDAWNHQDDGNDAENSFEIEFSLLPGARYHSALALWRARQPTQRATTGERRRRYSRLAALVAVCSLILINTLNLSGLFPPDLPLVSSSLSGSGLTVHAAGYSWVALRQRPLHLPALTTGGACPVTPVSQMVFATRTVSGIGNGTVFVASRTMDAHGVQHADRSDFFHFAAEFRGELVTWYVRLPDVEPVMIRGAQLDGAHILRFDGGIEQPNFSSNLMGGSTLPQLLIASSPDHGSPVAAWSSITRIPASGCYAYQVDTPTSSFVLVFKAVVEQ